MIRVQRRLREVFSEYLLLISILLEKKQTEQTLKLLNEVFVFDELWQEAVKAFTVSLFLADLTPQTTNGGAGNYNQGSPNRNTSLHGQQTYAT